MSLLTLLFSFKGRINRGKYWTVFLINLAVFAVCFVFIIIGVGVSTAAPSSGTLVQNVTLAVFAAICLPAFWSSAAVGIKRLHDRDQSGWWLLVFSAVSTAVSLLQESASTPTNKLLFSVGNFAVTVWITIELGCLRGTDGPNRFGPDPVQASPR